ncbi:DUF6417 family protein [Streptomyces sp. NPDC006552]|uniref:DUF6417 family protein n=1 Tax=Streptomyces sp. NPDC006552 TaxID=3157179 RepID=UPI0033A83897
MHQRRNCPSTLTLGIRRHRHALSRHGDSRAQRRNQSHPGQDGDHRGLEMLTFDEGHDLLRLLQVIAGEGLEELSEEADWFAREIAARLPSEN